MPPIEHLAGAKIFSKIDFTRYRHPIIAGTDDIENAAVIMAYGNGKWTPV